MRHGVAEPSTAGPKTAPRRGVRAGEGEWRAVEDHGAAKAPKPHRPALIGLRPPRGSGSGPPGREVEEVEGGQWRGGTWREGRDVEGREGKRGKRRQDMQKRPGTLGFRGAVRGSGRHGARHSESALRAWSGRGRRRGARAWVVQPSSRRRSSHWASRRLRNPPRERLAAPGPEVRRRPGRRSVPK